MLETIRRVKEIDFHGWKNLPQVVEIQQEDHSENYKPTLGWSLRLFLGGCLFIDA